ncbi:MAG: FecR domain-containing protein [Asticcacaulis sp.]
MNREELSQEAAGWWLRLNETPQDEGLRQEATAWRNQSPAHEQAFVLAEQMWQMAGDVGPAKSQTEYVGTTITPFRRRVTPMKWVAGVAAGMAACLALVSAPDLVVRWQSDYVTSAGELQTLRLADGSTVVLDTDSAIALDYDGTERGVRLLKGRAWFDVTKDVERPFVVSAEDVRVEVLGTAFDVDLRDQGVDVHLREGRVRAISPLSGAHSLEAGDVLHLGKNRHADQADGRISQMAPEGMGLWRDKRLLIEDMSLEAALSELGRYDTGLIHIEGKALKQVRVTGVYDLSDTDRAVAAMIEPHGARMLRIGPLRVVHKNNK